MRCRGGGVPVHLFVIRYTQAVLPQYISRSVEVYDIAVIAIYRDIIGFYISRYTCISRQHCTHVHVQCYCFIHV